MLHLARPTRPGWIPEALASLDEVLLDHAHCEKKAASTGLSLVFRYPHHPWLARPLSELAREELEHFERMLDVLAERDIPFRRQRPSAYAGGLREAVRAPEPDQLIDLLLTSALIEARSCERMKLLSEALPAVPGCEALAGLYADLLASEARHHTLYFDLACRLADRPRVLARLAELALHESDVIERPTDLVRLHT